MAMPACSIIIKITVHLEQPTMNSQPIYIDSEETIYDALKENNPFIANTSTYSVSRTANHLSNRIQQASNRLTDLQTSLSKSKNLLSNYSAQSKSKGKGKKVLHCQDCELDQSMYEKMIRMSMNLGKNREQMEELEDKCMALEAEMLRKEEKFLCMEKKYILQINQLKEQLNLNDQREWKIECEKSEIQNKVQESQQQIEELEERLMECAEEKTVWAKRSSHIGNLRKKYSQILKKKEAALDSTQHSNNEGINMLKQFLRSLKSIEETGDLPFFNQHRSKKNKIIQSVMIDTDPESCESRANCKMRKTIQPAIPKMIQSYCIGDSEAESDSMPSIPLTHLAQPLKQKQGRDGDLYRLLFAQAESIEKLVM